MPFYKLNTLLTLGAVSLLMLRSIYSRGHELSPEALDTLFQRNKSGDSQPRPPPANSRLRSSTAHHVHTTGRTDFLSHPLVLNIA